MHYVSRYLFLIITMKMIVAELTSLDDIKYYEIIQLRHIDEHGRSRRDLSTLIPGENRHLDESTFTFFGHGRHFNLKIYKNNFLIPDSFVNVYQNSNGSYGYRKNVHNCYYHGYLVGRGRSFAALNTCFGLKGVIRDEDQEEFIIEPQMLGNAENRSEDLNPKTYVLFKSKDVSNKDVKSVCGVSGTQTSIMEDLAQPLPSSFIKTIKEHHRSRRSNNDMKYVETVVVLDKLKFKQHNESIEATEHRAFEIFNLVDSIYKTMDTRVAVVNMVIWNIYNMATVSHSAHETLTSFERYTRDVLRNELKLTFDNAQLISTQSWGNLAGLAGVGVICSMMSSAVNRDHNVNPAITANTVAHEMGHNIGFMHNTNSCVCHKEPCVMSGDVPWEPCKSFTDCARNEYTKRLTRGDLPCLLDFPGKLYSKPSCGNGYVEEGEECDCGSEMECKKMNLDKCCNFTTCKLQKDAQCAMGACCEACMFKRRGIPCRGKVNEDCDLEEFCTGKSGNCPKNFHLQDGTSCKNGIAYCYQGACKTHETQCQMLWGINATRADDVCFTINAKEGSEWGNCGRDNRDDYIRCQVEDELCGKLQCTAKDPNNPLPRYPIIGHDRARRAVTFHIGTKSISCILGSTTVSADLQDPTMTDAGVKCGNKMICVDHKCSNISSLPHVKTCSLSCLNSGGVCNNNGNCHCPKGKACPYCELAGPGGSADSGQGCLLYDNCIDCFSPLAKGLMILFLLVVPVIIVCYVFYRHRMWIRDKFCGERQVVNDQWSSEGMSDKEIGSDGRSNGSPLISPMGDPQ